MADVLNLHSPNVDATALIEEVLGRLRSGEALAVAVVEIRRGRVVATAYSKSDQYHFLNSGAARLSARLALDGII